MDSLTDTDLRSVGEFRLLARLGAGGMGQVFLASSLAGRMVAVKVIHAEHCRDPEFVRRFRGEVEAAQRVSGWYTAPVVAAGVDDTPPWLATAFVPGPPLDDIVEKNGPLPVAAVWRLAAGLAEALRAIHGTGLVHRDLKPANVLMAPDGPRVIDFGISRAVADTRLTASGAIIGTPSYMSPEQVEGAMAGPASDVFSFGSVLAFAATGNSPFQGSPGMSAAAVMYRIVHGEPNLAAVPGDLRSLIQACLAKDPGQRPDLARVAAGSTAAAERLGLSPAQFWPPEVAQVIQAQQAGLNQQIAALGAGPAVGLSGGYAGTGAPSGLSTGPGSPLGGTTRPGAGGAYASGYGNSVPGPAGGSTVPPGGGPSGPYGTGGGYPGGGPSGGYQSGYQDGASQNGSPSGGYPGGVTAAGQARSSAGTSRRGLLIGAGVGGVAVVGGALGWVLSSRSGSGPTATGTGAGGLPTSVPTNSALQKYYGEGEKRTATWSFPTGNSIQANAGTGNGMVFIGSTDDSLYAISTATGKKSWSYQTGTVYVAPEVIGDIVGVVTSDSKFIALDVKTGRKAWELDEVVPALYHRTWAVYNGQVILYRIGAPLQAHDPATGVARGVTYGTNDAYYSSLTVSGDVLYALDQTGGNVNAYRADTGDQLWQRKVLISSGDTAGGLLVSGGSLYLGTSKGTVYALDSGTGKVDWTYKPGNGVIADLSLADGLLYVKDEGGNLHAVTASTGKQAWVYASAAAGFWGPAVAGGRIYFTITLALQALDAKTGKPVWAFSPGLGKSLMNTPAVADGLVFIGSSDDALYAVKA